METNRNREKICHFRPASQSGTHFAERKARICVAVLLALLMLGLCGCGTAASTASTKLSEAPGALGSPETVQTGEALDAVEVEQEESAETGAPAPHAVTPEEAGIRPGTAEDYTENVLRSSAAHVRDGQLYLACQSELVRASLDKQGEPQDGTVLMDVMPTVNSLAGDGEELYLATNDGIFALPVETLEGAELTGGRLVAEYDISTTPFYIWSDWLFFLFDEDVYVVPKAGGQPEILAEGAADFQVTDRGLFCTNQSGALTYLSFEDGETTQILDSDCGGRITFLQDTAYITTGKAEPRLYAFAVPERQSKEIVLTTILSATHGVWTEPGALVCQADDGRVILYDLGANSETALGEYNMPYYEHGELAGGVLYNMSGDEVTWMHLDTGETGLVQMSDLVPNAATETSA